MTSRLALAAAASLMLGGIQPAMAADLGGNCCADLEERIAELEATTVRKSNKIVSLTLGGQISRGVLWYDDGSMTGFRVADNIQSSSRFRMQGSAKIGQGWSAGYYLEVELVSTGSFGTDQIDSRRSLPTIDGNAQGIGAQPNGHGNSPFSLGIRQSHWFLKNDRLGTVSVGHLNSATKDFAGTDLGGIVVIANSDLRIIGGEMFLRRAGTTGREGLCGSGLGCTGGPTGSSSAAARALGALRWTALNGGFGDNFRFDGIRYDSPTFMGFTFSAAVGDDVRWDVALRHEAEWNGLRVATAIGYVVDMDEIRYDGEPGTTNIVSGLTAGAIGGPFSVKPGRREQQDFKINSSAWHMPTGLFVSGAYWNKHFAGARGVGGVDTTAAEFGTGGAQVPDKHEYWIAAGVKRNWFGIGYTSLYGEWGKIVDPITGLALDSRGCVNAGGAPVSCAAAGAALSGGKALVVRDSTYDIWGLGVVQNIDKAAMELYLGFQHRSADIKGTCIAATTASTVTTPVVGGPTVATPVGTNANGCTTGAFVKQAFEDLDTVYAGARIKF